MQNIGTTLEIHFVRLQGSVRNAILVAPYHHMCDKVGENVNNLAIRHTVFERALPQRLNKDCTHSVATTREYE